MNVPVALVLAAGAFIAYVNGGNDVSKGVATLVGSGITNYRRALLWGAAWTGLGSLAGSVLAAEMLRTFGKGLLVANTAPTVGVAIASIAGTAAWVALASRLGLPVSTTHAIVGAAGGVACLAYGPSAVNFSTLAWKIAFPLLVSPLVALIATSALLRLLPLLPAKYQDADCACLEVQPSGDTRIQAAGSLALAVAATPALQVVVADEGQCAAHHAEAPRLTVNHLHWLTSGATSFARGLNDAPKIAALVLAGVSLSSDAPGVSPLAFTLISLGMVAGSWVAGRRVTSVLAEKVTLMDHREGFVANLVTAALVGPGGALGLPMSTTHVSSAGIAAVGLNRGNGLNLTTLRQIVLAWLATLPAAALLGIAAWLVLSISGIGAA